MAETEYRRLSCRGCGAHVAPKLKMDGTPRKNATDTCSKRCMSRLASQGQGKPPSEHLPERPCAHCAKPFRPALHAEASYCGKRCSQLAWRRRTDPLLGKRFDIKRARHAAAEEQRIEVQAKRQVAEARRVADALDARACRCGVCGIPYSRTPGVSVMAFCSDVCGSEAIRQAKRMRRDTEKARLRGAVVENVDPLKVFERDRWHCYLCGVETPKELKGSYEDDAPELEHVHPLSKGGAHGYENLRCACRSCNLAKKDMLLHEYLASLPGQPVAA